MQLFPLGIEPEIIALFLCYYFVDLLLLLLAWKLVS